MADDLARLKRSEYLKELEKSHRNKERRLSRREKRSISKSALTISGSKSQFSLKPSRSSIKSSKTSSFYKRKPLFIVQKIKNAVQSETILKSNDLTWYSITTVSSEPSKVSNQFSSDGFSDAGQSTFTSSTCPHSSAILTHFESEKLRQTQLAYSQIETGRLSAIDRFDITLSCNDSNDSYKIDLYAS